jgi:hypothetical protein
MSLAILSIFGSTGLLVLDGGGAGGAASVATAALDSACRITLNITNVKHVNKKLQTLLQIILLVESTVD